jgi:hypothetical protein
VAKPSFGLRGEAVVAVVVVPGDLVDIDLVVLAGLVDLPFAFVAAEVVAVGEDCVR